MADGAAGMVSLVPPETGFVLEIALHQTLGYLLFVADVSAHHRFATN